MSRRLLYFPMLVNEIKRHFGSIYRSTAEQSGEEEDNFEDSRFTNPFQRSMSVSSLSSKSRESSGVILNNSSFWWFSCKLNENDLIIPLHLPVGLIFDLVSLYKADILPWKLEFHISNSSPNISIVNPVICNILNYTAFPDESSLSSFYFSSLKESDHLRSGSARNVMNLTRSEQLQLWEALRGGECDRFWRINQKLVSSNAMPRSVPIKFYLKRDSSPELVRFQFPVALPSSAPSQPTLKHLFDSEFPSLAIKRVLLHGVCLPLHVTLDELNWNWNYADNFINMIVLSE